MLVVTWQAGASAETSGSLDDGHQFIAAGWWIAELVTMMTNSRRRALHDLIAGTVVIKKSYEGIPAPWATPTPAPGGSAAPGW